MSSSLDSLIVDWPDESVRRSAGERYLSSNSTDGDERMNVQQSDRSKSHVRFNTEAKVVLVRSVTDMKEKYITAYWYSQREYRGMKRDMLNDAHSKSSGGTTRGLEHLLSSGVFEERKTKKERVIAAVLREQDRQEAVMGYRSNDAALAIVSSMESRKAREYAISVGASDAAAVVVRHRYGHGQHSTAQLLQAARMHCLSSSIQLDSPAANRGFERLKRFNFLRSDSIENKMFSVRGDHHVKSFNGGQTKDKSSLVGTDKVRNESIKEEANAEPSKLSAPLTDSNVTTPCTPKNQTSTFETDTKPHPLWIE